MAVRYIILYSFILLNNTLAVRYSILYWFILLNNTLAVRYSILYSFILLKQYFGCPIQYIVFVHSVKQYSGCPIQYIVFVHSVKTILSNDTFCFKLSLFVFLKLYKRINENKSITHTTLIFEFSDVRVFTRMISDNPWCSLLVICSLRLTYNVTFSHCIPSYSWPQWMTINRFCFLNDNFKKHFKLTNRRYLYWDCATYCAL